MTANGGYQFTAVVEQGLVRLSLMNLACRKAIRHNHKYIMNADSSQSSDEASPSAFPRTLWTIVLEASSGDTPAAAEAMGKLCATYREPILAWLQRRGYHRAAAEDLAHGFIEYLLQKNRLKDFEKGEAKFRSFILKCLKRYLRGEWRKETAGKRGSGMAPVPLDERESGAVADSDKLLDRSFAVAVH